MSSRSEFLKKSIKLIGGVISESLYKKLPEQIKNAEKHIFPPGAVHDFISKCTVCGECIPVCPENCIKIISDDITGKRLPVIIPEEKACTMCEQLACIQHCQPKALVAPDDHSFPKIGFAKIIKEHCLAYNNNSCMTCYDACPLKRQAIKMKMNKPIVVEEYCTGCAICENVCILTDEKGVKVFPL